MQVQDIAINTLKPNRRNAHTHSKKQVSQIAESIRQFGFVVPIIADETWRILCGHGRYQAGTNGRVHVFYGSQYVRALEPLAQGNSIPGFGSELHPFASILTNASGWSTATRAA